VSVGGSLGPGLALVIPSPLALVIASGLLPLKPESISELSGMGTGLSPATPLFPVDMVPSVILPPVSIVLLVLLPPLIVVLVGSL